MSEPSKRAAGRSHGCTVRDPVHDDIALDGLEKAIMDTRIFQRLRYIKQNGLLHFVFPGAVHTRFAHSLGTMHVAGRVARSLFGPLKEHLSDCTSLDYLGRVFRLAALLHDVGHCAFSHSIEHVLYDGEPLLGTTRELFGRWGEEDLLRELEEAHAQHSGLDLDTGVTHEEIGLILIRRIFAAPRVAASCAALGLDAQEVGKDVCALIDGGLSTSGQFRQASIHLQRAFTQATGNDVCCHAEDIAEHLHYLVSGTLDVDRLDYLVRDSFYCGVAYGQCQVDLLVRCLSLGVVEGQVEILLDQKAAHALDDMLWSRYQLFLQVYNHKTNVGLNALLEKAIPDAINRLPGFARPTEYEDFITFIDDYVIGTIFHAANHTRDANRFTKLLVDRRAPRHLHQVDLARTEPREQRATTERDRLADQYGISPDKILTGIAQSKLRKSGNLPLLVNMNRRTQERKISRFEKVSFVLGKDKMTMNDHRVLHFFVEQE